MNNHHRSVKVLRRGDLAKLTGCNLETIRYYKTMVGFGISAATGGFRRGKWFTDQMGPDWVHVLAMWVRYKFDPPCT